MKQLILAGALAALAAPAAIPQEPMIVVAEGERFTTTSVATRKVTIPTAGRYRVWSRYQAPPYFDYAHRVEITQGGRTVFSHVYGRIDAPRFWSFSGAYNLPPIPQCWWPWGADHDAAEDPREPATPAAGEAEIRLVTVAGQKPAGDRMVDCIILTTRLEDAYKGWQPYGVASPFAHEALDATRLYVRFFNSSGGPAQLTPKKPVGHFQPSYGGHTWKIPGRAVEPGTCSEWTNIGPSLRLVHDENLRCGANYSPHGLALYYGPIGQWVDMFKHDGMGLFWTEDYVFSVQEIPQIVSWMFAVTRCAVKYRGQPIHFYALRHAGHAVDLLTEDDIAEGALEHYDVVHFAGEWIDPRLAPRLREWVQRDGILYACAGCGPKNAFGEPDAGMAALLGLKDSPIEKNMALFKTLLELPLAPPIDEITLGDVKIEAVSLKQSLVPDGAKVVGTWSDGTPAVTVREDGRGRAFAVGTPAFSTDLEWADFILLPQRP